MKVGIGFAIFLSAIAVILAGAALAVALTRGDSSSPASTCTERSAYACP